MNSYNPLKNMIFPFLSSSASVSVKLLVISLYTIYKKHTDNNTTFSNSYEVATATKIINRTIIYVATEYIT